MSLSPSLVAQRVPSRVIIRCWCLHRDVPTSATSTPATHTPFATGLCVPLRRAQLLSKPSFSMAPSTSPTRPSSILCDTTNTLWYVRPSIYTCDCIMVQLMRVYEFSWPLRFNNFLVTSIAFILCSQLIGESSTPQSLTISISSLLIVSWHVRLQRVVAVLFNGIHQSRVPSNPPVISLGSSCT